MKKFYSAVIFGIALFLYAQLPSIAINEAEQAMQAVQEAGSINPHDMENLKRLEEQYQIQEEFKTYKERAEQKEKVKKPKREKKKVQKAKPEDYAKDGVYIHNIEVTPSNILTKGEINDIIEEYTQDNLSFEQLQEIVNKINTLYAEKGFVTARAYLPVQTIENETVKIVLVEGKTGEVNIADTKWTRKSHIKKRLNLKKGKIFNISDLEHDLVTFNRYNDTIQLRGSLAAGKKNETTDITITPEEKLPFHLAVMSDNQGRDAAGKYRAGVMLQHDSLFGFRDRLTIGSYVTKSSVTPFADYNIPVNRKDGRIGICYSYGDSKIKDGAYKIFNIQSRSHNAAAYYTQPIIRKPWMELASNTSAGFKYSETLFEKVKLYDNKVPYVQTGLSFRYDTKRGIWYLNQNAYFAFPFYQKDVKYLKISGGAMRLHDFGHGFTGIFRADYQFIPGKDIVPYTDQMTAGGMNSGRGYTEGLLIGKDGYTMSAELQFPILPRTILAKDKERRIPFVGNYLKGFVFADHAGIFPYKGTGEGKEGINQSDFLMSLGCGFKINLPKDINVRLAWGFPVMRNSHENKKTWGKFHFEVSVMPDFDYLLSLRKPKNQEQPVETVKAPEINPDDIRTADNSAPQAAAEIVQNKSNIHISNIKKSNNAEEEYFYTDEVRLNLN